MLQQRPSDSSLKSLQDMVDLKRAEINPYNILQIINIDLKDKNTVNKNYRQNN